MHSAYNDERPLPDTLGTSAPMQLAPSWCSLPGQRANRSSIHTRTHTTHARMHTHLLAPEIHSLPSAPALVEDGPHVLPASVVRVQNEELGLSQYVVVLYSQDGVCQDTAT